MELLVLGCSGSASGPESAASSYLVRHDGFGLVLDFGPGAFGALHRWADPTQVDAIALSHLHPDHCLDLCAWNVGAQYSPTAPWPVVPVYGPAGTAERLARAYEPEPGGQSPWRCDFRTWAGSQQIGPFTVRTAAVPHSTQAYAIRVEAAGHSLTYSGDTGPSTALVELARGTDLLLAEASFTHSDDLPEGIHLSARQAAEHAAAAGAGQLVLTHIPLWHDPRAQAAEAAPYFAGPQQLARPGLRIHIA